MAAGQATAKVDFSNPATRACLQSALDKLPAIRAASLCDLDSGTVLTVHTNEDAQGADDAALLTQANVLFSTDTAPGTGLPERCERVTLVRQTIYAREAENLVVRRCPDNPAQALLISVSTSLPASVAAQLSQQLSCSIAAETADAVLSTTGDVLAAALIGLPDGALLHTYRRADAASQVKIEPALTTLLAAMLEGTELPGGQPVAPVAAGCMERVTCIDLLRENALTSAFQVPMMPETVVMIEAAANVSLDDLRQRERDLGNDVLRLAISALLNDGLETRISPFPETETEFLEIVSELRALDEDDLVGRLVVGGFAPHGFGEEECRQQCRECIYYLPRRKWCDIPELPLPVEPEWWCRLWKL